MLALAACRCLVLTQSASTLLALSLALALALAAWLLATLALTAWLLAQFRSRYAGRTYYLLYCSSCSSCSCRGGNTLSVQYWVYYKSAGGGAVHAQLRRARRLNLHDCMSGDLAPCRSIQSRIDIFRRIFAGCATGLLYSVLGVYC